MPNRTALRLAASILALASGTFAVHGAGTVSGGSTSKAAKSAKPVASVKAKRAAAAPVKADAALPTPELSPRRVLVRTKPGVKAKDLARLDAKAGVVKVVFEYTLVPGLRCVEVKPGREDVAVKAYKASSLVRYAHRDRIVHAAGQTVPYGVVSVRSPQTWTASRGGGAVVAVLDTGFDFGHPDLPEPMLSQSFVTDQPVQDGNSHGTHCSGTVLAVDDAGGVVGVAPSASLMIGKVLGDGGSGSTAGVMAGAEWAATNGADVISMSLGSTGSDQAEADLYAAIHAAGVLIVAAAGNNNSGDPFFPASYPGVLSVAAVDSANNRAGFSNFGPNISVAAPGVGVLSTVPTGVASWADINHESVTLAGSARGSASGLAIDCGLGGDPANFPAEVAGNIALIRRGGGITFATKAANAVAAGAVGVIIANNAAGLFSGTLNGNSTVPVIGISQADGDDLLGRGAIPVTIATSGGHGYAAFSGTSMACPHVAGVAALLIAEVGRGRATPALLREAMEATATDLGDPGRDDLYGHGLVNAEAAAAYLRDRVGAWCMADFDDNGGVDGLDVEAFFTRWMAGQMMADVNLDAAVDPADVGAFLAVWTAGGCN